MFPVSRAVTRLRKMDSEGERGGRKIQENWQRNEERERLKNT